MLTLVFDQSGELDNFRICNFDILSVDRQQNAAPVADGIRIAASSDAFHFADDRHTVLEDKRDRSERTMHQSLE